ncbi:hypothetical protein NECAME_00867 [Necator americanus]|uniref:Uncharacterized protein n=1 Tax=Necator americanus TaxID=51031 RepID=W2SNR0_NECAM|nr:hypothetical protein NECAME_00867 [Necator americanus]ETN71178.1 hypothetical protein NECAME_00867 [Necator americanus]
MATLFGQSGQRGGRETANANAFTGGARPTRQHSTDDKRTGSVGGSRSTSYLGGSDELNGKQ